MKIFLFFLLLCISLSASCNCDISSSFTNQQNVTVTYPLVSTNPVIIDGINYGYLVKTKSALFLSGDVMAKPSITQIKADCPNGYRVPTLDELSEILMLDINFITSPNGLNVNSSNYYVSSFKTYNTTKGNNAYTFVMLIIDKNVPKLANESTYFYSSKLRAKCVLDFMNIKMDLNGLPEYDLIVGQSYTFSNNDNNGIAYFWDFGSGNTATTQSVNFTPLSDGCNFFTVKLQLFSGDVISQCITYWATKPFGNNNDLIVRSPSDLNMKVIQSNVKSVQQFFFVPCTAPVAPKPTGGAYVLFSSLQNSYLNVIELDQDLNQVNIYNLSSKGSPLDIIATSTGYIAMISGTDSSLYIVKMDYISGSWSASWNRTIMDNGKSPTIGTNQITFYTNDTYSVGMASGSNIEFGMNAMFNPENGRLSIGRGRLSAIFAHYNNFGSVGDHTGDTVLNFDIETGTDIKLGWSWGSSHSLFQQIIYDGKNVLTTALGDAYPEQVTFSKIDSDGSNLNQIQDLIPGNIPGDCIGGSSGRLGGLVEMQENVYVTTYARRSSSSDCETEVSNSVNELGMVVFNSSLDLVFYRTLLSYSDINVVKSAKLGNRILIGFTRTSSSPNTDGYLPSSLGSLSRNTMYIMMVTVYTAVVTEPFVSNFSISANDDWRVLQDGTVLWTYVNNKNELELHWVKGVKDSRNVTSYGFPAATSLSSDGHILDLGFTCSIMWLFTFLIWII